MRVENGSEIFRSTIYIPQLDLDHLCAAVRTSGLIIHVTGDSRAGCEQKHVRCWFRHGSRERVAEIKSSFKGGSFIIYAPVWMRTRQTEDSFGRVEELYISGLSIRSLATPFSWTTVGFTFPICGEIVTVLCVEAMSVSDQIYWT